MNGLSTHGHGAPRPIETPESSQPSQGSQIDMVKNHVSTPEPSRAYKPLGNFKAEPYESMPLLTIDGINAVLGNTSQATLDAPISSDKLTWTTIPRTASTQALPQTNSEIVLNQAECTNPSSNVKSKVTKRSSIEPIESQQFSKVPKLFSSSTMPQMTFPESIFKDKEYSKTNKKLSNGINIQPKEPPHLLIKYEMGAVVFNELQEGADAILSEYASPEMLTYPSISVPHKITTNAQILFQGTTDAAFSSSKRTDKTPKSKIQKTNKPVLLTQLLMADNVIGHPPVASDCHVNFTIKNAVIECLKNEEKMKKK